MTLWMIDGAWRYETFPTDAPPSTFGETAPMVARWQEKITATANGRFPAWSDFDLPDLEGFWGWAVVYDAVDLAMPSFRVRLWGTQVARTCGYDLSGQLLTPSEEDHPPDYVTITQNDLQFLAHLVETVQIGYMGGPYKAEYYDLLQYRELLLPLSDGTDTVTSLLMIGRMVSDDNA